MPVWTDSSSRCRSRRCARGLAGTDSVALSPAVAVGVAGDRKRRLGEALVLAGQEPISVIGGADIFQLFQPLADRIELTEVLADVEGDTFIDDPRSSGEWREAARDEHLDETLPFRFVTLERA